MAITTFEGKTAFVTGGASGIGLGIAKSLAARGAQVVIADLRPDHIEEAMEDFAGAGRSNQVSSLLLDVTSREAYAEAAEKMERDFGGVDVLVNNAGVGPEGPVMEATYADYDFGFGVNIGGVINGFVSFLPQMVGHGRGGHILSTASLAAEVVMPGWMAIYAASKAAVCHYCEAVKPDLAKENIGISILLPGPIKSKIHETGQNRPEHLRGASGFAASEAQLAKREVGDWWMEPEDVGEMCADAILEDRTYIVTHGIFREQMEARSRAVMEATPEAEFQMGDGDSI